ncbi:MAG: MFS transporter, partial [Candidatus Thorarchaeota archaeon]
MPDIKPSTDDNPTIMKQADSSLVSIILNKSVDEEEILDLSLKTLENIPGKKTLYSRSVLATFSSGMVDPFLTTIAIDMGSTGSQMGWLRAITNLLGNFIQPFFGFLSDKVRMRSLFIALSNILYSGAWIILLFINNVTFLIAMAGFLSLVVSLGAPAWTALLGDVIPHKIRGKIIANINWYSQFSAILSTIIGGILFNFVSGQFAIGNWTIDMNMLLPIMLGLVAGIGSAILMFTFNESKANKRANKIAEMITSSEKSKKQKEIDFEECSIIQRDTTAAMDAKPNITIQSQ